MNIIEFLQKETDIDNLRKEALNFTYFAINSINTLSAENVLYKLITENTDFGKEFPYFESPKISIIIPVKNNALLTKIVLNSIYKNTKNVDYEVIIADDNSTDETKDLNKTFKNISIVKNNTQISGFVYNVSNAIEHARGEYIFLMNNDMITQENYLTELLNVIENHSDIGIAGAKNLKIDGTILECGVYMNSQGLVTFLHQNSPENTVDDKDFIECDYCSGCSILFKKEVWNKAGGFDKNYAPAYYEDSDFAFNLKYNLGLKSVCVPKSKIYHFKGQTYEKNSSYDSSKNRNYFLNKWENILKNKN